MDLEAIRPSFEPVGNIANDNDRSGNEDRGHRGNAGTDNERDTTFVRAVLDSAKLNFLQNHVVGDDSALRIESLRCPGHVRTRLQKNDRSEGGELEASMRCHERSVRC